MNSIDLILARMTLAAIWLATGVLSMGIYPREDSLRLLARAGLEGDAALFALYLAASLDILLGLATLARPGRTLWMLQAGLVTGYTLIVTFTLPEFWLHPFGPMLKNLAVFALLLQLYRHQARPA